MKRPLERHCDRVAGRPRFLDGAEVWDMAQHRLSRIVRVDRQWCGGRSRNDPGPAVAGEHGMRSRGLADHPLAMPGCRCSTRRYPLRWRLPRPWLPVRPCIMERSGRKRPPRQRILRRGSRTATSIGWRGKPPCAATPAHFGMAVGNDGGAAVPAPQYRGAPLRNFLSHRRLLSPIRFGIAS